jgi:hypothetical protein
MAKKTKDEEETQTESDGSIAVNDAWTGMLAVSLLALIIGSGFLYYDYQQYNEDPPKVSKFTQTPPGAGPAKKEIPKVEPKDGAKDAAKDGAKDAAKDGAKDAAKDGAKDGKDGDK